MSHVVSAAVHILDLECLKKALLKFPKLRWMEGQKTYVWWGRWANDYSREDAAYKNGIAPEDYGKSDHVIRMDGVKYEIGVVKRKDGDGYSLVWDFYSDGKRLSEEVGKGAEKLLTEYSREFINQFANTNGFMLDESEDSENFIMNMMT